MYVININIWQLILLQLHIQFIFISLVSIQFALHYMYCCEACMRQTLENISSHLRPGGILVGTTTDANVIVKKLRQLPSENIEIESNEHHYKIKFTKESKQRVNTMGLEPFGVSYNFELGDRVEDCTEYLMPMCTLSELAKDYNLKLEVRPTAAIIFIFYYY